MSRESKVMMVEDEKGFAEMMSAVLAARGFEVRVCHSGEEALARYQPGTFDLLISDLVMPGMNGIELVRRVRQLDARQCIVMITGFPSPQLLDETFERVTLCFLTKPFTVERFMETAVKCMERSLEPAPGPAHLTFEDLVHLYSLEGKRVVLEVHNGPKTGLVWFRRGEIVHAQTGSLKGEEAFFEIQSWRSGMFATRPPEDKITPTIHTSVDLLLLKGARLIQERTAAKKTEPGP